MCSRDMTTVTIELLSLRAPIFRNDHVKPSINTIEAMRTMKDVLTSNVIRAGQMIGYHLLEGSTITSGGRVMAITIESTAKAKTSRPAHLSTIKDLSASPARKNSHIHDISSTMSIRTTPTHGETMILRREIAAGTLHLRKPLGTIRTFLNGRAVSLAQHQISPLF